MGIGLAVSRQLAEMMEGTLEYVGTAGKHHFEPSFPLAPSDAAAGLILEGTATG